MCGFCNVWVCVCVCVCLCVCVCTLQRYVKFVKVSIIIITEISQISKYLPVKLLCSKSHTLVPDDGP